MKIFFYLSFCLIILIFCVTGTLAQKQTKNVRAVEAVKKFYRFHTTHDDLFNKKQVALQSKFFTPKLRRLFDDELVRQKNYLKKHPTDKPYVEGLSFQPIEFCPKDYSIGTSQINRQTATVKINFIYGKSSCSAKDGTKISYKILLQKISGKWLVDNVIYEDGSDLISAFREAKKIK